VWRRSERAVLAFGGVALTLSLTWAPWPLPDVPPIDAELAAPWSREEGVETVAPLDRAAFAARIWNPPVSQQTAASVATTESPAPPPRLQLIGIVHDTGPDGVPLLRAALYDPDTDKLHLVASGERVGAVTVAAIDRGGVSLETAGRTSRLALRDEGDRR